MPPAKRLIVLTGATRGLGGAMCNEFAVAGRNKDPGSRTRGAAPQILKLGHKLFGKPFSIKCTSNKPACVHASS